MCAGRRGRGRGACRTGMRPSARRRAVRRRTPRTARRKFVESRRARQDRLRETAAQSARRDRPPRGQRQVDAPDRDAQRGTGGAKLRMVVGTALARPPDADAPLETQPREQLGLDHHGGSVEPALTIRTRHRGPDRRSRKDHTSGTEGRASAVGPEALRRLPSPDVGKTC